MCDVEPCRAVLRQSSAGRVRRWRCRHPLPSEPYVIVSHHTAQAWNNAPWQHAVDPIGLGGTSTILPQSQLPIGLGGGSRTSSGHCGRADISASLPDAGWLSVLVRPHRGEVCRLSPWGHIALRLNPYPSHYRTAFACSPILCPQPHRHALWFAFPEGRTTGLPCSASIPERVRSCLWAGDARSAAGER